MGRNAAIKQYDSTPPGQPMDLFSAPEGRRPIVAELLKSPWIVRASELVRGGDAGIGKRRDEPVEVVWDEALGRPRSFVWRERAYRIDGIAQTWAVERSWWNPRAQVSRRCWRVIARGGTYDLAYEREDARWVLLGICD